MTDAHESTRAVLSASCALGSCESHRALCVVSLCSSSLLSLYLGDAREAAPT